MVEISIKSRLTAEFIGTFMLVFTVAANSIGGTHPAFASLSIGGLLAVVVYAIGGISGAHVNPAVTVAVALVRQIDPTHAVYYVITQVIAGVIAAVSAVALYGHSVNIQPGKGYSEGSVAAVEIIYTAVLVFVVLNTACSKKDAGNQYFGVAIGGAVVAGAYAAGAISGGVYNPAIAFGIDISSIDKGFGYSFAYAGYQVIGAVIAVIIYRVIRPSEYGSAVSGYEKLIAEFVGTGVLVTTVSLAIQTGNPAAVISIAAILAIMIYSVGSVSGGHLNPAVTVAVLLSGRKIIEPAEAAGYIAVQICGGIIGGIVAAAIGGVANAVTPVATLAHAVVAEIIYTALLTYVVLTVATTRSKSPDIFGIAIGATVVVGGFAASGISGGSLNPAVSFGLDLSHALYVPHSRVTNAVAYSIAEVTGGAIAAAVFTQTHSDEYTHKPIRA